MAKMFRSTLRMSYADWSRAVDAGTLPEKRRMLALVDKIVNERYAPAMREAINNAFFYGAGFCAVSADSARSIPPDEVILG